jgi:diguanylate cyclase (GGDEF)-like protein
MTLRRRLTLVLALLVALPVAAAAFIVGLAVPGTLRSQSEESLAVARGGVAAAIAARCDRALLAARSLGLYLASAEPRQAVGSTTSTTGVDFAALFDSSGRVVADDGDPPVGGTAPSLNCSEGEAAGPALVAQLPLMVAKQPKLDCAVTAQVVDRVALTAIRNELGTDAQVTLLLKGRSVSSTMPENDAQALARAVAGVRDPAQSREVGQWLAVVALPGNGQPFTVVVAKQPPSSAAVRWAVLLIVAIAIAAAVIVARALAKSLTRPLDELTRAASDVASGDLATKLPARGEDEVGRLSAAFNNMTAALRLSMTALERSRDDMRLSIHRLGDALSSTHDLEGICHIAVETALSATVADAGVVVLVNGRGDLELVCSVGLADHALSPPGMLTVGQGVLGRVAADDQPIRAQLGRDVVPDPDEPGEGYVLAVPLRRKSGVGGVLAVYVLGGNGFDDDDEVTLRTLAHQAGIAIDNAILHVEAERLSITDALTGVANYRHLMVGLSREVERAARFGRPLAVLMLDLDHFKQVNDLHGHERGNVVLREVAQRIQRQIRDIDTVARYGGEEFVLLLPETGVDGAGRVAQRVCEGVRAEPFGDPDPATGATLRLTVSIGGAVFPQHGGSAATLIASADNALYFAKRAGRDQWVIAGQETLYPPPTHSAGASPTSEPAGAAAATLGAATEPPGDPARGSAAH